MSINRGIDLDEIASADCVDFDPSTSDLVSTNVQDAIEEVLTTVGVSASPGFSFGRSGNLPSNTWLNTVGGVPSNIAGITIALTNPEITQVYVANENINTFDVDIYEHDGDSVNLALVGSVSLVASRSGTFAVSLALTAGKQLATRVVGGSAKNCNVGLQLKGNV